MNTPYDPTTECPSKLKELARENPTSSLLIAVGCDNGESVSVSKR